MKCDKCGFTDSQPIAMQELTGIVLKDNGYKFVIHEIICKKGRKLTETQEGFIMPPKTMAKRPVKATGTGLGDSIRRIVEAYKLLKQEQVDSVDNWDKIHFARCSRDAKNLLGMEKDVNIIIKTMNFMGKEFDSKGLTWSLSAIVRNLPEWIGKTKNDPHLGEYL